jgi:hypothetical protein
MCGNRKHKPIVILPDGTIAPEKFTEDGEYSVRGPGIDISFYRISGPHADSIAR